MLEDPLVKAYSKDLSRSYDVSVRRHELGELERSLGAEADSALEWIDSCGLGRLR
jgi:hypothetical protein